MMNRGIPVFLVNVVIILVQVICPMSNHKVTNIFPKIGIFSRKMMQSE